MATFTLTKAGSTYTFDTSGSGAVTKDGAEFGTWTTNVRNQIVAQPARAGAAEAFDVAWQFNERNELCVLSEGRELCNFHDERRPRYDLLNAVLHVKPDFFGPHQFRIHGEWDLTPEMKLAFTTPDNTKSILDGSLSDLRSRFSYWIASKTQGREDQTAMLLFIGRWRSDPGDPAKLNFLYAREDGSEDIFVLPGDLQFRKGDNQLIYRFAKGKHQVNLVGQVRVSPDFQISYAVTNQVSSGNQPQVFASEIVIGAVFANPSFAGDMQLAVARPGGGQTVFTISGKFTAVRKSGTRIGVGFAVSGSTGGKPMVVAFSGTFDLAANGQLAFTFSKNAQSMTIGFGATDIRLGSTVVNATATIEMQNGKVVAVEAMFGIQLKKLAIGTTGNQ